MLTQAFDLDLTGFGRRCVAPHGAEWTMVLAAEAASLVRVTARPASAVEADLASNPEDLIWVPCTILSVKLSGHPQWFLDDLATYRRLKRTMKALVRVERAKLEASLPSPAARLVSAAEAAADGVSRIPGAVRAAGAEQAEAGRAMAAALREIAAATQSAADIQAGATDRATDRAARAAQAQIMSEFATSSSDCAWLAMTI